MSKPGVDFQTYATEACKDEEAKLLILSPHGADYHWTLEQFPELNALKTDVFINYLRIEQDFGADQIAQKLAEFLCQADIKVKIAKTQYHRGILDGGRKTKIALRDALPKITRQTLSERLTSLHLSSIDLIKGECERIKRVNGYVIDMHTMAAFSPQLGPNYKYIEATFENLEEYTNSYTREKNLNNLRPIDILTKDENGIQITDAELSNHLFETLQTAGYEVSFNYPYENNSYYMMNEYLSIAQGVAIDIPKHLFSEQSLDNFDLLSFSICERKVSRLARLIADAVLSQANFKA